MMKFKFGLVFLMLAISGQVIAGPNEACADPEGLQIALELFKDDSTMGRSSLNKLIGADIQRGIFPADYGFSVLLSDLSKLGVDGFVDRYIEKEDQINKISGIGPQADRAAVRENMITNLKSDWFKDIVKVYQNFIVVQGPAVAVNFDSALNRVTCSFDYSLDNNLIVSNIKKYGTEQEINYVVTSLQIQSATTPRKTASYLIQPNGSGGTNIIILKQRRE